MIFLAKKIPTFLLCVLKLAQIHKSPILTSCIHFGLLLYSLIQKNAITTYFQPVIMMTRLLICMDGCCY